MVSDAPICDKILSQCIITQKSMTWKKLQNIDQLV